MAFRFVAVASCLILAAAQEKTVFIIFKDIPDVKQLETTLPSMQETALETGLPSQTVAPSLEGTLDDTNQRTGAPVDAKADSLQEKDEAELQTTTPSMVASDIETIMPSEGSTLVGTEDADENATTPDVSTGEETWAPSQGETIVGTDVETIEMTDAPETDIPTTADGETSLASEGLTESPSAQASVFGTIDEESGSGFSGPPLSDAMCSSESPCGMCKCKVVV
jgi:hypothetical protein